MTHQVEPAAPEGGGLDHVRVRLDLAYDGTGFAGWAMQREQRTVAGVLTEALARVLRVDAEQVRLTVAGRTDSGVHASAQVCHVDVPVAAWALLPGRSTLTPADSLVRRLSGVLPPDVRVGAAGIAPPGFDARFSALRRQYAYRISDDPGGVPPLRRYDVLGHRPPGAGRLDADLMDAASAPLLGDHDFAAFCRPREGATTIRTLLEYHWSRDPAGLLVATVTAQAFCHSMVRALVGCVLEVGDGRKPVGWPAEVLASRRRDGSFGMAPARGLTLERVDYPPDEELALRAEQARSRRSLPLA